MMEQEPHGFLDQDQEINLLDYWHVVWRRRWLITVLCSTSIVAALILGLLSPKIYEARATVLLPREGGGSGLLPALGAIGLAQQISGVSLPSFTPNRDVFLGVLKSRTMASRLVERFSLREYYGVQYLDDAVRGLQGDTKITLSREGVIEIKVENRNPKMAAELANAYIETLDVLVKGFAVNKAGQQRRFIAEQLASARNDLRATEERLRQFTEQNRAVLIGDTANSMRLPATQVPKVVVEQNRLLREQKLQETVFMLLTQQLEQAKMNEAHDVPAIQTLDPAVEPIYKSKPKIRLSMAIAGAVSLFTGIFLAFLLEYLGQQHEAIRRARS